MCIRSMLNMLLPLRSNGGYHSNTGSLRSTTSASTNATSHTTKNDAYTPAIPPKMIGYMDDDNPGAEQPFDLPAYNDYVVSPKI